MSERPSGTVTFMFADMEGSTAVVERLGQRYAGVLHGFRELIGDAVRAARGVVVEERGDETFAAFFRASDAADAAVALQRALQRREWPEGVVVRARVGIHTGEPIHDGDGYLGVDVHRAARICDVAHGGQVVVSDSTRVLLGDTVPTHSIGHVALRGLAGACEIFQVDATDLPHAFPPPRASPPGRGQSEVERGERRLARAALRALARGLSARAARGPSRPPFQELRWELRRTVESGGRALRRPGADLERCLQRADAAVAAGDAFVGTVDRVEMSERLEEYRRLAPDHPRAARAVDELGLRIRAVETLCEARDAIDVLLRQALERVGREGASEDALGTIDAQIGEAVGRLEQALEAARGDVLAVRLHRTLHRGVFRAGDRWVVPYVDELGYDQRREFRSRREASDFVHVLRVHRKTPIDPPSRSSVPNFGPS